MAKEIFNVEKFRNMRTSYSNLEFLNSLCSKDTTYNEALTRVINLAKPILSKAVSKN